MHPHLSTFHQARCPHKHHENRPRNLSLWHQHHERTSILPRGRRRGKPCKTGPGRLWQHRALARALRCRASPGSAHP
jgi:hypothetical protein